ALVVAWAWTAASARERRWMAWPLFVGLLVMGLVGLGLALSPRTLEVKQQIVTLSRGVGIVLAVLAALTTLGLAVLRRTRREDRIPIMVGAGSVLCFMFLHVTVHTPRDNRAHPTREVALRFAATLPPGASAAYAP